MGDRDYKNLITQKKLVKTIALINNKRIIKNVFLHLDMSTFAFGFIPSILRQRYETAICILTLQILNFFIISFPYSLLTSFIVTGIASVITARIYLNYLVDEERFIPYSIWKDINEEDEKIEKQLMVSCKKMDKITILSTIFIVMALIFSLFWTYKKLMSGTEYKKNTDVIEDTVDINNSEMSINNYAIIATEDDVIHSVLLLNTDKNKDLKGVIYPKELQIQLDNTVDELWKLVDVNNKEVILESFKINFNIEIEDFVVINKDDDKEDIVFYEDIFSKLLGIHENDLDNKIRNLREKYSDIDEEKLREFYNSFKDKSVNISSLKYDTVFLGDIVEMKVLEALNLVDMANYEFIVVDKSILQNNEEVKSINEEYSEYLKAKNEEALKEETNNENLNNQNNTQTITPPSNSGQNNNKPQENNGSSGEIKPPTNNGQAEGEVTPPENNGQAEDDIKPPEENITQPPDTQPSDNGGEGENVNPQVSSDVVNENLID